MRTNIDLIEDMTMKKMILDRKVKSLKEFKSYNKALNEYKVYCKKRELCNIKRRNKK